jgi:hypothetical protein
MKEGEREVVLSRLSGSQPLEGRLQVRLVPARLVSTAVSFCELKLALRSNLVLVGRGRRIPLSSSDPSPDSYENSAGGI